MFISLFGYSHSCTTHDIMEKFAGPSSKEKNIALLSLF